ncbi:MAG: hypothetical protein H7Y04_10660 [Verrucomicrobia bacterium]|nr:hypothetical protein [Cytophagales bacterium]
MIKPYKSLLILLYTVILLGLVTFFFPAQIRFSDTFSLKSFSLPSIFLKEDINYADITDIQQKFKNADDQNLENIPSGSDTVVVSDTNTTLASATEPTISANNDWAKPTSAAEILSDTLEERYRIQYPPGSEAMLADFFRALQQADKQLIRILHYGDSQIEGDRITAMFRHKIQNRFGGCGAGMLPLTDPLGNRSSIVQQSDGVMQRYKVFGPDFSRRVANRHGLLGSYFKMNFTYTTKDTTAEHQNDSVPKLIYHTKKNQQAHLNLYRSSLAFPRENRFQHVKILYRNPESDFDMHIGTKPDTSGKYKISRDSSANFKVFDYTFNESFVRLHISFASRKSPEFYGICLDCNTGVAVDNMPFRGSSGIEFTRMNTQLLREQVQKLHVKLMVLQFGVNVVPFITKDYSFYENQFYQQLRFLKNLSPDVAILVVGVSDMSRKVNGEYVSYPNVANIRDAQRKAAFRAGCAFWDLYEAMGGENSMPSWVFAKPALANKDFTHFTPRGASLVAEMLYKALMSDYGKLNLIQ